MDMEGNYRVKSKMFDAVTNRMSLVFNDEIKVEQELKTISTRVTLDNYEKVSNLASMLEMSKSDFLNMIVTNACDDIIREYEIKFETFGLTNAETDEVIEKLNSGEIEILEKKERKDSDK